MTIDEEKIREYSEKPINQKAKLPLHLDATVLNKEQIRPIKKKMKILDTIIAVLSVLAIVCMQIEVNC